MGRIDTPTPESARESQQECGAGACLPKTGEQFHCEKCGMELQITKECRCDHPENVHFRCCDQEMKKR